MKTNLCIAMLCLSAISYAQNSPIGKVGINTTNPEEKLHVKGNMKTKGVQLEDPYTKLGASEGYSFLIKSPAPDNRITSYNQTFLPQSPAPLNLIQFKITCDTKDNDWVNQFDTKISSTKFNVIIASYGYNLPTYNSNSRMTPVPQIYAFVPAGKNTWHLKADYESFTPKNKTTKGVWTLNLVVFDKSYASSITKDFDVSGNATYTPSGSLLN